LASRFGDQARDDDDRALEQDLDRDGMAAGVNV
jgi:hypothetical protein